MLDKFLNRGFEEEKQRLLKTISNLEKDNENLRKRLSKRESRAAEDPARRQELEESLNRAQTKIQVLEHELTVSREESVDEVVPEVDTFRLPQREALEFMDRLSSIKSDGGDLLTIYGSGDDCDILSKSPSPELNEILKDEGAGNGFALFCDEGAELMPTFGVIPPFPVESSFSYRGDYFDISELLALINTARPVAFVLAHAGESYIGVADSKTLIYGDLIRSEVKEKHSKGGWSQKRFERLREEDIRHHVEKVRDAFDSMMDSHSDICEYVVLAGEKILAEEMTSGCSIRKIVKNTDIKPDRHCGEQLRKEIWSSVWYRV